MCGIAGSLSLAGMSADERLLRRMIGAIGHRGPDDTGIFCDRNLGLAHARLSIIDLSGGHQPMLSPDQSLCISFNGEIFNYIELREELIRKGHRFATTSDTEVILHMYQEEGENCVKRFNGQWSFAIWDLNRRKLFLSRDRFGVRPLFYTQTAGNFYFASEIKALLQCPGVSSELDFQSLDQIFTSWVTLPPHTAFRDVRQLPPGHSLTIDNNCEVRVFEYWRPEYPTDSGFAKGTQEQLTDELLDLLLDATRLRLRSDVPVGAYLSGGLDSTLITALTKRQVGDKLRTFSVSFEDAEFDESSFQKEASAFIQTQHSDVRCSYEDIAQVFPDVVWHAEQPILRTAPAPLFLLSRLVRNSGFKVVLTGEGADEMMGGYDIFKEMKIRRFWARYPQSSRRALLLKRLYPYMDSMQKQPPAYLAKFFHVTSEDLHNPFFSHLPRWDLTAKLKAFLTPAAREQVHPGAAIAAMKSALPHNYAAWHTFNQAEYLEAMHLLPGYILSSQGDRMAMAHSVEGRYPFLDHRVVEFAAKLPPTLKMKVLDQKYLLKRVSRGLIPPSITKRHKQPYRAPDGKSFFGPKPTCLDGFLEPGRIRHNGVFDSSAVAALVRKFRSGAQTSVRDNMALIGILSTEILLDRFASPPLEKQVSQTVLQVK